MICVTLPDLHKNLLNSQKLLPTKKKKEKSSMKSFLLLAVLALTVSASLKNNQCFMDKAGVTVADVSTMVKSLEPVSSLDDMEAVVAKLNTIKAAYEDCKDSIVNTVSLDAVLNNLGVGNLLLSQCTQDLGGLFLVLDSIVEDPKDVAGDIFGIIFSALMGKQAYGDCGQFVAFIQSLQQ